MAEPVSQVAILGAGNGGCAAAADLTRRGFGVRLYNRSEARLAPLRERGGVEYTGSFGDGFARLDHLTTSVAEAVHGADLVIIMAPMMAHGPLATALAPQLQPEQVLLLAPGHTALQIPSILRRHGIQQPVCCETSTLPYACRMVGPAKVQVSLEVKRLVFAAFPSNRTAALQRRVARVYPSVSPVNSVLETVFLYMNAIHHPPATLCNAGWIESTGGDYCHYYEGISPAVGRVIDALDLERRAVATALEVRTEPFVDYFCRAGYTTPEARDTGLAYEAFHQSEPDRWIKAPPSLEHRFIEEDVPFGLVPLAELGRLAGVPTPTMDGLIHLASIMCGTDYRAQGLSLERLGLADLDRADLQRILREGFSPLSTT